MSGSRQKLRAILLSFVMVTSIMAAGVAFTGTAAADADAFSDFSVSNVEDSKTTMTQTARVKIDADDTDSTLTLDVNNNNNADIGLASASVTVDNSQRGVDGGLEHTGSTDTSGDDGTIDISGVSGNDDENTNPDGVLIVTYTISTDDGQLGDPANSPITAEITDGATSTSATADFDIDDGVGGIESIETLDEGETSGSSVDDGGADDDDEVADNGQIDQLVVTFDQNVDDEFLEDEDFEIATTTLDDITSGGTALAADVTDDNKIVIEIDESGAADTDSTDETVTLDIDDGADGTDGNVIENTAGTLFSDITATSPSDKAAPALLDASAVQDADDDGDVDGATIVASEDVQNSFGSIGSASSYEIADTDASTIDVAEFTDDSGSTNDGSDAQFRIELSSGVDGTDVKEINYDGSGLTDAAGNAQTSSFDDSDITETDSADPVFLRAVKSGTSSIDAVFSESVQDADGNDGLDSGQFTFADQNGVDATSISSVTQSNGPTVSLTTNNEITDNDVGSDQLEVTDAIEDTTNDNSLVRSLPAAETIQFSSGVQLVGPSNTDISTDIGENADVRLKAGSAEQALGKIRIKDVSGDSPLAKRTLLEMPDGVTVDEAASDLFVTTTDGGISSTSVSIEDSGSTIRLDHTGSSISQEVIRLTGVVVNVAPSATASQTGADVSITVDYATSELSADLFKIERPSLSTSQTNLVAGQTTSTALAGDIDINTGSQLDNQIGNQTNVVVRANQSNGITFDSSIDPTKINFDSGGALIDQNNVQISQTELTIPVTSNFSSSDSLGIDADGSSGVAIKAVATGDATSSDLTVDVETFNSTGAITLQSSTNPDFNVQKPGIAIDDGANEDNAVIGLNGQEFAEDGAGGAGSAKLEQLTIEGSTADIPANTRLTISPNQSDVSFVNTDSANELSVNDDLNFPGDSAGSVSITSEGDLLIVNDGTVINEDFDIQGDVGLDIGTSTVDETNLGFNLTTNTGVKSVTDDTRIILERPNVVLNGGANASFSVDADGETGQVVADGTGVDALSIEADDLDAATTVAGSNITVELESGTGVTFDTSNDFDLNQDEQSETDEVIDILDTGDTNDGIKAVSFSSPTTIEIDQKDTTQLDAGESIDIDELPLNISGSASDTEISVTTDTGDNEVTTTSNNIISVDSTSADQIRLDPDINAGDSVTGFSFGADQATNAPTVDSSVTGLVQVQNGGDFGGAVVNLEIVETPDGSSGDQLNTTQVTTSADGTAAFNFTAGDTVGDYVVNATVASTGAGVNVTYTAQPGAVSSVNVTPIENAIAGNDGAETGVAALFINSTDANGNKVTGSSPTISITADNVGSSEVDATSDFDNTKTAVDSGGIASDGTFSIDSNDGSSVVYVKSSQVEDVTITAEVSGNSDTGTVTFFDEVGGIDLTLSETSAAVDETVTADATITEADGTVIEVPDVTVSYDDNNNGNTTFETNADSESATTNANGVASINVTAEQNGTSTIDASSNLRTASATLTIEGQATESASVTFNDQSVQNGTEEVTVASANYTLADGSEGDYVVVMHVVNDDGSISSPVGASSDQTGSASDITVDLNDTSAAFEDGDALDTLTENTTLRAMLHETSSDSAFGPSLGLATDDADITVTPESPLEGAAGDFDTDGNGDIDIQELGDAGTAFTGGELTLNELTQVAIEFTS